MIFRRRGIYIQHKQGVEPLKLDMMHPAAYTARHDIKAALHAHSPALLAYSMMRKLPDFMLIPNTRIVCGKVVSTQQQRAGAKKRYISPDARGIEQQLFFSSQGTISARVNRNYFLITPFGMDRKDIDEEQLLLVKKGLKEAGKTPSRAVFLHELIYHRHPQVQVIIAAHLHQKYYHHLIKSILSVGGFILLYKGLE